MSSPPLRLGDLTELTFHPFRSAQFTKKLIEEAGTKALLIPGDLMKDEVRKEVIDKHLKEFKFIGQFLARSTLDSS